MISAACRSIPLGFTVLVFFILVCLLQLMPAKADEIKGTEFNFVAAGDWGCGHEALNTFSMMKSMGPELYLGLGDYSYADSIDCWLNIVKSVGKDFKIVLGNHDTEGQLLQAYMDEFKLEKQYYSFDYRNAHFIALSTELNEGGEIEQLKFVKNDLLRTKANQDIDWIIVFFHKPFYSADSSDITNMRRTYHPVFENFGVDLVIQGHSHNYQRTYPLLYNDARHSEPIISDKEQFKYRDPLGIIFLIVGTGGQSIQPLNKSSSLASTYEGYGCINVEIRGKAMNVEYYSDTNNTIDKFLITKNQPDSKRVDAKTELKGIEYFESQK
ncbi:MAG: metallophosphoesterase [Nitrososphaeraceae archaeon]